NELHEEFFAQVVWSITIELQRYGYVAIFASSQKSAAQEKAIIQEHMKRFVDGFILLPCAETDAGFINDTIAQGYKLVTLDNYVKEINAPFIGTDFITGSYLATRYLLDSGHRQIGHLAGPIWAASTKEQAAGYRKACLEAGIEVSSALTANCEYNESAARDRFMELKTRNPQMTAVHCASLAMTNGILAGIGELGLSVPRDISIVDYGSTSFISSINQKAVETGQTVSNVLLVLIDGKHVPDKSIIIPELIIRNSSRRLNNV
ncbi:MAG: substrate-binding domain-containing protein, partial [Victivallaceae bacterium]|nr:substrate-binding domain-containing protein [Victivallaceae bacterium]